MLLEGGALLRLDPLSRGGVEDYLTESDRLGSDLDELLIGDKLDSLLEGELNGGDESELFISAGGADGGEVLLLTYVDLDVIRLGVLADDHTLIYGGSGADEERAAVLSLVEAVGRGHPLLAGNEGGGESGLDLTAERLIACEERGDKSLAASVGKELGAVTEQTSCGNVVVELLSCAVELHINEGTLSGAELFHYGADVLLGNVDNDVLYGLTLYAVYLFIENSGVGAAELVALATHIFYKDGEVHLSSARDSEGVGGITVLNTERNILKELTIESCAEVTGGDELALLTCEGRVVDREGHLHSGLTDLDELEGLDLGGGADCVTDSYVLTTGEANDVTDLSLGYGNALKAVKLVYGNDLGGTRLTVAVIVADSDSLALLYNASLDTAYTYSTDELVVVYGGDEELEGIILLTVGSGHILEYSVEKGCKILAGSMRIKGGCTRSARAEEHGRVELLVGRVKLQKELKDLVTYLVKTGVGTVDLVNNDYNSVIHLKSLLEHKACLGHRSLGSVDEKDNAVYHLKNTLYLSAEICVAGCIDNVDLNVLVMDRGIFCKDGDSALSFKVVRVHYSIFHFLIVAINTALTKHFVNQSCLSVVNVSDNCNIS